MNATEILTVVTLVMACISTFLSCVALWPQLKQGAVMVRDTVLWVTLIAIITGIAIAGWKNYVHTNSAQATEVANESASREQRPGPVWHGATAGDAKSWIE
ncbi:MAG: hypothetical protein R3E01_29040 [Pirellulaceae bacterium]|nr:hypothetical protein [Planctomycetales bacterium]